MISFRKFKRPLLACALEGEESNKISCSKCKRDCFYEKDAVPWTYRWGKKVCVICLLKFYSHRLAPQIKQTLNQYYWNY